MPADGRPNSLVIEAHEKPECQKPIARFEAYVNPSEITVSYEVEYHEAQGQGTTSKPMTFKAFKPGGMSLTFFLDGTGANGRLIDVQGKIEEFQNLTGYSGKLHRPRYLQIGWGKLQVRRCVLKGASIAYKLFRPDGVPLRAVITASFSDFADDQTRVAEAQDASADLTHARLVKAGDRLPALCEEIYGDPRLYLQVAAANQLDDFRALVPGTTVYFPPLEK